MLVSRKKLVQWGFTMKYSKWPRILNIARFADRRYDASIILGHRNMPLHEHRSTHADVEAAATNESEIMHLSKRKCYMRSDLTELAKCMPPIIFRYIIFDFPWYAAPNSQLYFHLIFKWCRLEIYRRNATFLLILSITPATLIRVIFGKSSNIL